MENDDYITDTMKRFKLVDMRERYPELIREAEQKQIGYKEFLINQAIEETNDSEYQSFGETLEQKREEIRLNLPPVPEGISMNGNGKAVITHCALMNDDHELLEVVEPGTWVNVVSRIVFHEHTARPLYGFTLFDRLGNVVVSLNSETIDVQLPPQDGQVEYTFRFRMPDLNHGEYTMSVAVANGFQTDHVQLCWLDDVLTFRVMQREYDLPGFLYLDHGEVSITTLKS